MRSALLLILLAACGAEPPRTSYFVADKSCMHASAEKGSVDAYGECMKRMGW